MMSKREVIELIDLFNQALNEAWNDLGTLRRLSEKELPNIFRHGDIGLSFYVSVSINLPEYLIKTAFGIVDAKISGVEFKDGVMKITINPADPLQRFVYEIDLSRTSLRLWEYALILLILQDRDFQNKMQEHINKVSITNATLIGVMQFLAEWNNQNSEG